ncbi:MAG: hypothetical protein HKO66_13640 [Saprospiraceae bacterium]|nr:hypothetical protein [Bacteroidia bacterium]NNE14731.1 hypothetical protein [Saprospiraceae bacterium]NNL93278.1 hypothetical protein [Saprospiraceae bacterium]
MRKSTFVKHINQLDETELREELTMLYDKIPAVLQFYKMELGTAEVRQKTYAKAKKEIEAKYKTKSYRRPRRPRIQKVKKIISELKKLSVFSYDMIDIYLFNTECALKFSNEYNYFSQPLFNVIKNSFASALELIDHNQMQEDYEERCQNVVTDSHYIYDLKNEMLTLFNGVYKS